MIITSELKFAKISPRKIRLLANSVKKMRINDALNALTFSDKKGAVLIKSVLESAIANAKNNFKINKEDLIFKTIDIFGGPSYKRWRAVARGSAHEYKKRTSHIKITLTKIKEVPVANDKKINSKEKKNGS